jgi:hypothetical protein
MIFIIITLLKILSIIVPLLIAVAYFTIAEKKIMEFKKYKSFFNKLESIYKFDTFILILGAIGYFCGYYFITLYALMHLTIRLLQTFSETFANKLISFKTDQKIIKNHYLNDFKFCYYFTQIVKVITGCFYVYFFYILDPKSLEQYSFVFFTLTYLFILTSLMDLGIIIYIILYKNNPVKETFINCCYHCVTKGIPALGALHMSSNIPMISPNPVTNYYHLWSPLGRGYAAYSSSQLLQVDIIKTNLGDKFDYTQCIDSNKFLDPQKIATYAKKHKINIKFLIEHNHYWWSNK